MFDPLRTVPGASDSVSLGDASTSPRTGAACPPRRANPPGGAGNPPAMVEFAGNAEVFDVFAPPQVG